MSRIDPKVLRVEREKLGWSLEDLARRSGVDAQSIHRIEKGGQKHNRRTVIMDLAQALGVSEDVLTGTAAIAVPEKKTDESFSESQLNLRVSDGSRNALFFTAQRYGVSYAQIVEIAPFLFFWAAEMSLQSRRNRLKDTKQKCEEISQIEKAFPHLHFGAFINMNAEDALSAEADSIEARDIFGTTTGDSYDSYRSKKYDESEGNPMTMYLKELVSEFSDSIEFEGWYPDSSPQYRVCKKEVLEFVGGNTDAEKYIHAGKAQLHKMPKELNAIGKEAKQAEWACEHGKTWIDRLL